MSHHVPAGEVVAAALREEIRTNERGKELTEFAKRECCDCGRLVLSLEDGRCASCNERP